MCAGRARWGKICAELANLREQAIEVCQETQRLIDEKTELLQALDREHAPESMLPQSWRSVVSVIGC